MKLIRALVNKCKAWRRRPTVITVQRKVLPVINMGYGFLNTIEGCTLSNGSRDIYNAVRFEFGKLPECTRHSMMFTPNDGEWVERAQWWREFLYGALPPKQAAMAMQRLLRWYRHCVALRLGKGNAGT
ncbi:hypothetical protein LJC74_04025 [Eubacteriales bacterium OttesenSCG-928-A19]|nr:hypothetical protein [Eubacteriales bacterium OttesenSCG-928-A19]